MNEWMNEWMKEFYNLYLHRETSRVKPGMCSPVVDGNYYVRRWLSVKDAGNYSTSRKVRTWRILIHVNTGEFWYFSWCSIHCVRVDTGVLSDKVWHLTPYLLQINKTNVKSSHNYWIMQNFCITDYKLLNVLDTFILLNLEKL